MFGTVVPFGAKASSAFETADDEPHPVSPKKQLANVRARNAERTAWRCDPGNGADRFIRRSMNWRMIMTEGYHRRRYSVFSARGSGPAGATKRLHSSA